MTAHMGAESRCTKASRVRSPKLGNGLIADKPEAERTWAEMLKLYKAALV